MIDLPTKLKPLDVDGPLPASVEVEVQGRSGRSVFLARLGDGLFERDDGWVLRPTTAQIKLLWQAARTMHAAVMLPARVAVAVPGEQVRYISWPLVPQYDQSSSKAQTGTGYVE